MRVLTELSRCSCVDTPSDSGVASESRPRHCYMCTMFRYVYVIVKVGVEFYIMDWVDSLASNRDVALRLGKMFMDMDIEHPTHVLVERKFTWVKEPADWI